MGTWISHLRTAEQLLQKFPELELAPFAFGSLAPDSGLPNADWTEFDPPKEVTHFLNVGEDEGLIKDWVFYNTYLSNCPIDEKSRYSYLLGYYFHLLCDNFWAIKIGRVTEQAYADQIEDQSQQVWRLIKRDWYGLDQKYVRDHPNSIFWQVIVQEPNPPPYLEFLPEESLHHQLDYIRGFYAKPDPRWELDRPYPYLNQKTMDRFVQESVSSLIYIYDQLDRLASLGKTHSALDLLPEEALRAYDPPLGD